MAKGGNYEREISVLISLYLSDGNNDNLVWHTFGSGGRGTNRRKANKETKPYDHGDLCPDDISVNYFFDIFSMELKTGYVRKQKIGKLGKIQLVFWGPLDILDSKQKEPLILQFWQQSVEDADLSKREPITIFRRNRRKSCIMMRLDIFNGFTYKIKYPINSIQINYINEKLIICNLNDFIKATQNIVGPSFIDMYIKKILLKRKKGTYGQRIQYTLKSKMV